MNRFWFLMIVALSLALTGVEVRAEQVFDAVTSSELRLTADDPAKSQNNITRLNGFLKTHNGSYTVSFPAGVYYFSNAINIPGSVTIEGQGDSTILKHEGSGIFPVAQSSGNSNVTIRNLTIDGSKTSSQWKTETHFLFGVYLTRCTNSRVIGVRVVNIQSDGIVIEMGSGNEIQNCTLVGVNKAGIYFSSSEDGKALNNNVNGSGTGDSGIQVSATWRCVISGNKFESHKGCGILLTKDSRYLQIENNTTDGIYSASTPFEGKLHGITYSLGPEGYGIYDSEIVSNAVTGKMLSIFHSARVQVRKNRIRQVNGYGIIIWGSSECQVLDNYLSDIGNLFPQQPMIFLAPLYPGEIGNAQPIGSNYNLVRGNQVYQLCRLNTGIQIGPFSSYNLVVQNDISASIPILIQGEKNTELDNIASNTTIVDCKRQVPDPRP